MLETILSGVLLAVISGLTFIAYRHPKAYRNILQTFAPGLVVLFVMAVMFYTIDVAVSIRSIGQDAEEAASDRVTARVE